MTTFDEVFRFVILPAMGTVAFVALCVMATRYLADLLRKVRA